MLNFPTGAPGAAWLLQNQTSPALFFFLSLLRPSLLGAGFSGRSQECGGRKGGFLWNPDPGRPPTFDCSTRSHVPAEDCLKQGSQVSVAVQLGLLAWQEAQQTPSWPCNFYICTFQVCNSRTFCQEVTLWPTSDLFCLGRSLVFLGQVTCFPPPLHTCETLTSRIGWFGKNMRRAPIAL